MNLPLSFSPLAKTSSVEETEQLFKSTLVNSHIERKMPQGEFGVQMNQVLIGNSALSYVRHSSDYEIDCGDVGNSDSVIFSFGQSAATSLDGRCIDVSKNAVIVTRHSNMRHFRKAGSHELVLKVSTTDIQKKLQAALDRSISRELHFADSVTLDNGIGAHGAATLRYVVSSLDKNPTLLESRLIASSFETLLTDIILALPHSFYDELLGPAKKLAAPDKVIRAEEYMEANAHLPITLTEVISHVGCSKKAFYSNFRRYREYSPHDFLIDRRLRLAHERLSNPDSSDTVTSIAYDSGFSHMGRFSQAYYKRYGVKPSDTLRRT